MIPLPRLPIAKAVLLMAHQLAIPIVIVHSKAVWIEIIFIMVKHARMAMNARGNQLALILLLRVLMGK